MFCYTFDIILNKSDTKSENGCLKFVFIIINTLNYETFIYRFDRVCRFYLL